MTTIYEAVKQIDAAARELVRHLDAEPASNPDALLALRIVDRAGDIKRALGMPEQEAADAAA